MAKPNFQKISSWDDFEKKLTTLNKKEKGDYFEYLTKYYLKIDVKYQSYDEVWLLSELPNKERAYLGFADKSDIGIDLIAKNGNEYYAIQCKYHSDFNSSVTRNEIAPFLTMLESNPKITKGFVASTANTKSPTIKKSISKPLSYLLHDTWDNLSDKFFKDIQAIEKGKAIKPTKPLSPRPHQKKALKDAVKHFEKENEERGKLIFPCGAGKSLTGFWMTQQLKSKATLIAVPSLSLVKQTLEVYLQEIHAHGKTVKWLCICSDDGIGKTDDVVYYTEDLGVPCETDPEFIEQWLKENQDDDLVVFTTYQSGRIIADISQKLDFTFDVGIYDEAHKTVGSNKKLFSHLLFEENISVKKRIFMTATERFYGGSKDDIISMDDEDIYGDTFTQMSFKEAIESNLLTDYKVITIDVKKSEISEFIRTNNLIQLNDKWKKETEARSLASMLALRKAMKKFDIKNAVSFHSSIEKAVRNKKLQKHITDTYNFQPIDTFTVSGKQGTTKRNQIVKEFAESSKALITNAKCLTEGVDVPNIDCIVFSDPKRSKVDIVQALGRALRKKDGKEWGYVVLPVIYDEKTNEIDNDNFDEILAIVRGLASNDERIVEYFKDKNQKEKKGTREGSQFQLEVVSEYMDEEELTKQLEIRLWEKLSKFNWMPFKEAREFAWNLRLKGQKEWKNYARSKKRPNDMPTKPWSTYKSKGWIGLGDWLGLTPGWNGEWRDYISARKYVRGLKLKNQKEWIEYSKSEIKPFDIPATPDKVYKDEGWISLSDWLGSTNIHEKIFMEFEEARQYIRSFNLKGQKDYREWRKSNQCPSNFPSHPQKEYVDQGWLSFGDFIGTTPGWNGEFLSYEDAKEFIRDFLITSKTGWRKFCNSDKKPFNIPSSPRGFYKEYWLGWGDFLGTNTIAPQNRLFPSLKEAILIVRKIGLKTHGEWTKFKKSSDFEKYNLPKAPEIVYKDEGWKGYPHFFSKTKVKKLGFNDARTIVRKLKISTHKSWQEYSKTNRPDNIPSNPNRFYKNEWKGWDDFLGKE
ncbi:DEAD/DEAH box helicase family protein [Crocinitomicaceae bacterium]|nr:DEAD/DEAH box helicase family protein [Crocinitomicaceae bacterium]